MTLLVIQKLILDFLLDLIYFPVWWYTGGVWFIIKKCWEIFLAGNARLAPGLWLKNIFVPMYGQWDWQGRIISFFMRLVQVIGRSITLLFWSIFVLGIFWAWIILPILIIKGIL